MVPFTTLLPKLFGKKEVSAEKNQGKKEWGGRIKWGDLALHSMKLLWFEFKADPQSGSEEVVEPLTDGT